MILFVLNLMLVIKCVTTQDQGKIFPNRNIIYTIFNTDLFQNSCTGQGDVFHLKIRYKCLLWYKPSWQLSSTQWNGRKIKRKHVS